MRTLTTLGSPLGVTITVTLVAGLACWQTRRARPGLLAATVLGGAELLETITKTLVAGPRPPLTMRVHGVSAVLLTRYTHRTATRAAVWARLPRPPQLGSPGSTSAHTGSATSPPAG